MLPLASLQKNYKQEWENSLIGAKMEEASIILDSDALTPINKALKIVNNNLKRTYL